MGMDGVDYCGGAADLAKYFDTIPRKLVYMLMKAAGIPTRILTAYESYQEELAVRNSIGGALGEKYKNRMGIGDAYINTSAENLTHK